jgi:hypothetical protein
MPKKLYAYIFFCLIIGKGYSQENTAVVNLTDSLVLVNNYPEGVYITFDDFLNKNSINLGTAIERRKMVGFDDNVIERNAEANQVFFYNNKNNSKITNYFAISYNASLYIQQRQIQKLASKKDKNQEGDNPNSYHRVLKDGKFLYLEVPFANGWSKGFAYGSGGAVGGVIGASLNSLKAVVFDINKKEFVFMRKCEDLKILMEKYNADNFKCDDKNIDILFVRESIDRIIK